MQFIVVVIFIYLFIHIWFRALFPCVKDRACLRLAIPSYYFNIIGSVFGFLFCLLIKKLKKLILGSKTIWQSMRKFPCEIWSLATFGQRRNIETFFLEKYMLAWFEFFLDNYFFMRPRNQIWKFNHKYFWMKYISFCYVQKIYAPNDF